MWQQVDKKPLRVLFVHPVNVKSLVEMGFPHLGLGSLSASMKKAFPGLETKIVRGHLQEWIHDWQPDIAAITSVSQYWDEAKFHAERCKQGGLPVIMGGVHATNLPETMTDNMDVLVLGEGEMTILDLLRVYQAEGGFRPAALRSIPGLAFKDGGEIVKTVSRSVVPDLDALPHIDRTILAHNYHTGMFTSRGCPYSCTFCASSRYWPKLRFNSARYVVEEIESLYLDGVNQITLLDDLVVANRRRLEEMVELLGRKDLLGKLSYICNVRSNLVTDSLCRILRELGVKVVGIGMESANPESLAYLKGPGSITVEDHVKALGYLRSYGIEAHPSFIIGSPRESREQILDSYRFIKQYHVPDFEVYPLMPFPGTPVWEYAARRGLVQPDMDWGRLRYSVEDFGPGSIVMSETLKYADLAELYQKFTDLRIGRRRRGMILQAIKHPLRAISFALRLVLGDRTLPSTYPPRRRAA